MGSENISTFLKQTRRHLKGGHGTKKKTVSIAAKSTRF
jgi:hypothetical protein